MARSHRDRRRRMRAKVSLRAHIRGGMGTMEVFEDISRTLDVSRDGLLMSTARGGYWVGQALEVTCPYWTSPTAINMARRATVVRSVLLPNFRYALAVQFDRWSCGDGQGRGNGSNGQDALHATPFPGQVKVLGVERDPGMARAMRERLESDGYQVVLVETAQQALEVMRSELPDVLIAEGDGEICGQDLCAIVKTHDRLRHIPVILLTRSALPSDYSAGRNLGAVLCMKNPYEPERLHRAVNMVAPPPAEHSVYSGRFNMGPFVRTR